MEDGKKMATLEEEEEEEEKEVVNGAFAHNGS